MRKGLTGNEAAAKAVILARPKIITAYPITPQTTLSEKLAQFCAENPSLAEFINVESEDSAMAALIGASIGGVRAFTATSSQGLLYMHQLLHWAANSRLPLVMVNVNRALAPPWNIWADTLDGMSQRDTGWIQFYCESCQEILDTVIQAFRIAEKVSLPVMVNYEGFILSHTTEGVEIPEQKIVDSYLLPFKPPIKLKLGHPQNIGGVVSPEEYQEMRFDAQTAMEDVPGFYQKTCANFKRIFGRSYGAVEKTGSSDLLVVALGTVVSTLRELLEQRKDFSLLKIKLFHPFSQALIRKQAEDAKKIAVIDRNLAPGTGGILAEKLKASLYGLKNPPEVYSFVTGIGGVDITPEKLNKILDEVRQ